MGLLGYSYGLNGIFFLSVSRETILQTMFRVTGFQL